MAPEVWFVLNLRKSKLSYLEVSGGGLTLTNTSVVTVADTMNGQSWDVSKAWLYQGKLRLRLAGKRDAVAADAVTDPTQTQPAREPPTTGTVTVTVTNPPAGSINVQVGYVDDDGT